MIDRDSDDDVPGRRAYQCDPLWAQGVRDLWRDYSAETMAAEMARYQRERKRQKKARQKWT